MRSPTPFMALCLAALLAPGPALADSATRVGAWTVRTYTSTQPPTVSIWVSARNGDRLGFSCPGGRPAAFYEVQAPFLGDDGTAPAEDEALPVSWRLDARPPSAPERWGMVQTRAALAIPGRTAATLLSGLGQARTLTLRVGTRPPETFDLRGASRALRLLPCSTP
ncbi:hypothetical protein [Deinococcus apachensis]|uniref:hypothetical protein n=1 Tax=Deinococcus apachensis TaxID=309886 RepID=UPI00036D034E|nr:hypothetical protein [Deinococcus apachensis]